ncbi:UNKNOWN [Stylonychia lemnae]|uniref:Uncharacterized protein n=1 Tax=Stylonychia lemnae TaxID=5949 RepID=A0A078AIY6_STYLE|nr:UNKNOWN [Stylonychia lemnae]|eukprot:CDW80768.1 UNKNOWN [Stylonychia lemnae]
MLEAYRIQCCDQQRIFYTNSQDLGCICKQIKIENDEGLFFWFYSLMFLSRVLLYSKNHMIWYRVGSRILSLLEYINIGQQLNTNNSNVIVIKIVLDQME